MPAESLIHINVYAEPAEVVLGKHCLDDGSEWEWCSGSSGGPPRYDRFYNTTFEAAAQALSALPHMLFEPDGSFVWSGQDPRARWQIDGHLFDFSGKLHRVELHGTRRWPVICQLLACVGWPQDRLVFELPRYGAAMQEPEFRRWLAHAQHSDR